MAERHCFIVGPTKIIGADAIIGNSCAGFPIWSVPCDPATMADQTCGTVDLPDESAVPLLLADPAPPLIALTDTPVVTLTLTAPTERSYD